MPRIRGVSTCAGQHRSGSSPTELFTHYLPHQTISVARMTKRLTPTPFGESAPRWRPTPGRRHDRGNHARIETSWMRSARAFDPGFCYGAHPIAPPIQVTASTSILWRAQAPGPYRRRCHGPTSARLPEPASRDVSRSPRCEARHRPVPPPIVLPESSADGSRWLVFAGWVCGYPRAVRKLLSADPWPLGDRLTRVYEVIMSGAQWDARK